MECQHPLNPQKSIVGRWVDSEDTLRCEVVDSNGMGLLVVGLGMGIDKRARAFDTSCHFTDLGSGQKWVVVLPRTRWLIRFCGKLMEAQRIEDHPPNW